MGQRPNELTPHASLHHYWGAELRALRTGQGLSLAELGHRVHCDPSYLAKIERAERPIPATLAESCDRVLQTQGMLIRLHTLTESDRDLRTKPGPQLPDHVADDTTHVANPTGNLTGGRTFPTAPDTGEEIVIPACTSDGRVVFVSVPRRVFLQGGLGSAAMGLTAIPAATSAHGITLPADINPIEHFQQLRRVLIENDRLFGPQQIIPIVREQIAIIQQLRSRWRGADHQELVRIQALYTDLCGFLYQDAYGEHHLAESWTDRALTVSHLAEDQDLAAYILAGKADLACDMQIPVDAIGAAEKAVRIASPCSHLAASAATIAGHGYALSGDRMAMEQAYERARELFATSDTDPDSPYGGLIVSANWIALRRARSLVVLRDYHSAAQSFLDEIPDLPGRHRRGRGLWLARASRALVGDHQIEHAATLGLEALAIGAYTGSMMILTELAQLNDQLASRDTVPAVAEFRTAMKETIIHQA